MTPTPLTVHDVLARLDSPAIDEALLGTLDELTGTHRLRAIETLVARGGAAPLTQLLERYADWPPDCRAVVRDALAHLEAPLRQAVTGPSSAARSSAIAVIVEARAWHLGYVVAAGLRLRHSTARREAADALRDLAAAAAGRTGPVDWCRTTPSELIQHYRAFRERGRQRQLLAAGMRDALAAYDTHRRLSVLEACLVLTPELEGDLLAQAESARSAAWAALCDAVRLDANGRAAGVALAGLAHSSTAAALGAALGRNTAPSALEGLAAAAWRLGERAVADGCARALRHLGDETVIASLTSRDPATLRRILRVIAASHIADEVRIGWYRDLALSGTPEVQHLAVLQLVTTTAPETLPALQTLVHWTTPETAALVRREIDRRVPVVSGESAEPPDAWSDRFQRYWEVFEQLDDDHRVTRGAELQRQEPHLFGYLSAALGAADPGHRWRAVQMVRTLDVARHFGPVLQRLTRDGDPRVRSAAVKALVRVDDPEALHVVERALRDPDHRVRANAVEALDEAQAPRRAEQLHEPLNDPHHRVRAAAIAALLKLRVPDAAVALLKLLDHPSRAHRSSALYVLERLELGDILKRVSRLAEDPDLKVQRRARRLLRRLRHTSVGQVPIPAPQPEVRA